MKMARVLALLLFLPFPGFAEEAIALDLPSSAVGVDDWRDTDADVACVRIDEAGRVWVDTRQLPKVIRQTLGFEDGSVVLTLHECQFFLSQLKKMYELKQAGAGRSATKVFRNEHDGHTEEGSRLQLLVVADRDAPWAQVDRVRAIAGGIRLYAIHLAVQEAGGTKKRVLTTGIARPRERVRILAPGESPKPKVPLEVLRVHRPVEDAPFTFEGKHLTHAMLEKRLSTRRTARDPGRPLCLEVDAGVSCQLVVDAIGACAAAGVHLLHAGRRARLDAKALEVRGDPDVSPSNDSDSEREHPSSDR